MKCPSIRSPHRCIRIVRSAVATLFLATLFGALLRPADISAAGMPAWSQAAPPPPIQPAPDGNGVRPPLTGGAPVETPIFANPGSLSGRDVSAASPDAAPVIDVWYGDQQRFGHNGQPIRWVNILGNVSPAGAVVSLEYKLNNGAYKPLDMGSTSRRLYFAGDFSVEIDYANLQSGDNTVTIRARNTQGQTSTRAVTLTYTPNQNWPLPYVATWGDAAKIEDVAQVTDGLWTVEGDVLRPQQLAYDRLVAIGDQSWRDYEVTVPVTIHGIDPSSAAFGGNSGGPGIGLLMRWQGHFCWGNAYPTPDDQLCNGWQRLGALDWFRWAGTPTNYTAGLQRLGANTRDAFVDVTPDFNQTYLMKAQVKDSSSCNGGGYFGFKVWLQGDPEPAGWNMAGCDTDMNGEPSPASGSFLLVAHHVDASFGPVTVTAPDVGRPTLSVTAGANGSASASPQWPDYTYLEKVTLTAIPDPGYAFSGWSRDISSTENPLTFEITQDTSVTANFVKAQFTLDVGMVGQGTVKRTPDEPDYAPSQQVQLEAIADPGWRFDSWSGALSGTVPTQTLTMTQNEVVTATFTQEYYGIDVTVVDTNGDPAPGAGVVTVSPPADPAGYVYNESVTLNAIPAVGWSFVRWDGDVTGTATSVTAPMTGNFTVRAVFEKELFDLTITFQGAGTIEVTPAGPYQHNATVLVTALPAPGWLFDHWEGDAPLGQSQQERIVLTMESDKSLTAVFIEAKAVYLPLIKR